MCHVFVYIPGRAAQRLQEQVSGPGSLSQHATASTIHRLLRFRGRKARAAAAVEAAAEVAQATGSAYDSVSAASAAAAAAVADEQYAGLDVGRVCEFGKDKPLPVERLFIDEVSMMDVPLAAALFNAIK